MKTVLLGSERAGAALIHPDTPSMDLSIAFGQQLVYQRDWHSHYMKALIDHGELARPVIYTKGKNVIIPCYNGCLKPTVHAYELSINKDIVFYPTTKKYYSVLSEHLREPTDPEYEKFFKKDIQRGFYKIVVSKLKVHSTSLSRINNFKIVVDNEK